MKFSAILQYYFLFHILNYEDVNYIISNLKLYIESFYIDTESKQDKITIL